MNILKSGAKFVLYLMCLPVYLLASMLPKKKGLWVIGAWFGRGYRDNPRVFYEFLLRDFPEIEVVWFCKDRLVFDRLKREKRPVLRIGIRGIWTLMRAEAVFVSHSDFNDLLSFAIGGQTLVVNLWHGMPIKKIGLDEAYSRDLMVGWGLYLKCLLFPFLKPVRFDVLVSSSEFVNERFMSGFGIGEDRIWVTGYPRHDLILRQSQLGVVDKGRFLYLPTFRRGDMSVQETLFEAHGFSYDSACQFLADRGLSLDIRLHPIDLSQLGFPEDPDSPIQVLNSQDDLYDILGTYDGLIVDYTSAYFDYLILNRPIVFAPFDYVSYQKNERGFYDEYSDITPGPKAQNWPQVLEWMARFSQDASLFSEERSIVSKRFNSFEDGANCERIYRRVLGQLGR